MGPKKWRTHGYTNGGECCSCSKPPPTPRASHCVWALKGPPGAARMSGLRIVNGSQWNFIHFWGLMMGLYRSFMDLLELYGFDNFHGFLFWIPWELWFIMDRTNWCRTSLGLMKPYSAETSQKHAVPPDRIASEHHFYEIIWVFFEIFRHPQTWFLHEKSPNSEPHDATWRKDLLVVLLCFPSDSKMDWRISLGCVCVISNPPSLLDLTIQDHTKNFNQS